MSTGNMESPGSETAEAGKPVFVVPGTVYPATLCHVGDISSGAAGYDCQSFW